MAVAAKTPPAKGSVIAVKRFRFQVRTEAGSSPAISNCESVIVASHLTKVYRLAGGRELTAVDDLSFRVQAGEVFGLLGPNGAGKSTTMRMLLGLLAPTSGTAEIGGFCSVGAPLDLRRQIGLVSADAGVYPFLTVRETLSFFADLYGLPQARAEVRIAEVSEVLEITDLLDRRAQRLSTGQKQRVNLARALVHDPSVVLLDEPTRGLDIIGSQIVFDYVAHLRSLGKAVVVCTHGLEEAERLCDRFGLLHQGRLAQCGTLEELRQTTGCQGLVEMFLQVCPAGLTSVRRAIADQSAHRAPEVIPQLQPPAGQP